MARDYRKTQEVECAVLIDDADEKTPNFRALMAPQTLQNQANLATNPIGPHFSENLWEDALKRHCDARQNLRNLLDRYIKPHH
jgi:hypothetical protein